MTLSRLPSGRWRARVWHDGRDQSVAKVLGLSIPAPVVVRKSETSKYVTAAEELATLELVMEIKEGL